MANFFAKLVWYFETCYVKKLGRFTLYDAV